MNDAFSCYGKVFASEELLNINTNGLVLSTSSLVQRFCETHERCMYMEAVQQAESEGDILKA